MKAVIVAAGEGKRLMPLTAETPKPLLRIGGTPILTYLLRGLRWAGVTDALIVVRHLGEKIIDFYGDGAALGMNLEYAWQDGPNGTGSALLAAEPYVGGDPFLLLWGDVLMSPENYRRIVDAYQAHPCDLLSGLNRLDDPSTGASVCVDGDWIVSIIEKPPPGTAVSDLNQAGLFVCTSEVSAAMRRCGLSPRGEIEFTSGVQLLLAEGRDVRWMPVKGFWSDTGTHELLSYLESSPHIVDLLR